MKPTKYRRFPAISPKAIVNTRQSANVQFDYGQLNHAHRQSEEKIKVRNNALGTIDYYLSTFSDERYATIEQLLDHAIRMFNELPIASCSFCKLLLLRKEQLRLMNNYKSISTKILILNNNQN